MNYLSPFGCIALEVSAFAPFTTKAKLDAALSHAWEQQSLFLATLGAPRDGLFCDIQQIELMDESTQWVLIPRKAIVTDGLFAELCDAEIPKSMRP